MPTAPDGRYDTQVLAATETTLASASASRSHLFRALQRVGQDAKLLASINPAFAPAALDALFSKGALNDRSGLFNMVLSYLGQLPEGTKVEKTLNDKVITLLYHTITHPPATYLGTNASPLGPATVPGTGADGKVYANGAASAPHSPANSVSANGAVLKDEFAEQATQMRYPYAFRSADGAGNNPLFPNLGRAGMPYARSVQGKHPFAPNTLPDPGVVFDSLLSMSTPEVRTSMYHSVRVDISEIDIAVNVVATAPWR